MRRLRLGDLGHGWDDSAGLGTRRGERLVLGKATHSNGISALQLQSQLGLGSYKSVWPLCAKLRRAMVAPSRALLSGVAEVDETELPLRAKDDPVTGAGGRSGQGKMLVAGAVVAGFPTFERDVGGRNQKGRG